MPALTPATTFCNKIQTLFSEQRPIDVFSPKGFLQAMFSERNLAPTSQIQSDIANSNGVYQVYYSNDYQRALISDVLSVGVDGEPDLCAPGTMAGKNQHLYEFNDDQTLYVQFSIEDRVMRTYCADDSKQGEMAQLFRRHVEAFYRRINRHLISRYMALRGTFADGSLIKTGNAFVGGVLDGTTNSISQVMQDEFDSIDVGSGQTPFVVGWNNIKRYVQRAQFGCCNDAGLNMQAASDFGLFFKDQEVASVLTPNVNQVLAWRPGTIFPVQFDRNIADFEYNEGGVNGMNISFNSADSANTRIIDNTGAFDVPMSFDMYVRKSDCNVNTVWTITLRKLVDLVPAFDIDAFQVGDPMRGVNGALVYNVTAS